MRDSPLDHRYFYCLMCTHVCEAKKKTVHAERSFFEWRRRRDLNSSTGIPV